jgi:hypothetical protein
MTLGLLIVSAALFIQSQITPHTGYGLLLPGFVLMGIGMGLVMSPMSTAAMNAVDRTKAGVASGTLSMSRMVGGTFGVAVMGALVTAIGRSDLNSSLPHLPASTRQTIANALGSGGSVSGGHVSHQIVTATNDAFVSALGTGLTVSAIVAAAAAALAAVLIQRKRASTPTIVPEPQVSGEAAARELAA